MRPILYIYTLLFLLSTPSLAQDMLPTDTLPYYEIGPYPTQYSQQLTVARMIDGLGYRYHWASKDLRTEDLAYEPGNEGGSMRAVIEHILSLSNVVLNSVHNRPNSKLEGIDTMSYTAIRSQTLENLAAASSVLKSETCPPLDDLKIIFVRGDNRSEYPFWHVINGPITDAIYHTGQIVSYRRSAGNPIDAKVNVFMGKNRE